MGEALLFSQENNDNNTGAKHKEQWLSVEDPTWVTVHNNVTLPSADQVSDFTLKLPNSSTAETTVYIYNGLTKQIKLKPNSIIYIKNTFTTTATNSTLTDDTRYVYYYDSKQNQIGKSEHNFSSNNFVNVRTATAYPCSDTMDSSNFAYYDAGILQLKGNLYSPTGYNYGVLVPEDGIINIAIGRNKDKYNNISKLPFTFTTQYSYINFAEHFSEEEYEYHKTLKSLEGESYNTTLSPYTHQISNSYIPTIEAANAMPYSNSIFLYNGTLYAFAFHGSTGYKSSSYKIYK